MYNYIIAIVLIVLGNIGGIYLIVIQLKDSENDKIALNKDLTAIKNERDILKNDLEERDKNISEQTGNIIQLSNKLAKQSEYIQSYISGGDGYLFLDIRTFPHKADGTQEFIFQLNNKFEMPIYNISCDIIDFDILSSKTYTKPSEKLPFIKYSDYYDNAYFLNLKYPEIQGKHEVAFTQDVLKTKNLRYYARISTRNRNILEKITIFQIGDNSFCGYAIYDMRGNKLYEKIDGGIHNAIKQKLIHNLESMPNVLELGFDKD